MTTPRERGRPGPTVRARVTVFDGTDHVVRRDTLAAEEPLEIRLAAGDQRGSAAVTMRTPGHDFDLAVGWLYGEGLIVGTDDLLRVDYCTDVDTPADQQFNIVTATLRSAQLPAWDGLDRHVYTSSACGVCGRTTIDTLLQRCTPVPAAALAGVDVGILYTLAATVRGQQDTFERTGGLHAAAVASADGTVGLVREDVGRHNAVDKIIGRLLIDGLVPAFTSLLFVSGRTSFEIVQKAAVAGFPLIAGVSAPSSLAVELADRMGITLVGFLRDRRCNVYTHAGRLVVR